MGIVERFKMSQRMFAFEDEVITNLSRVHDEF